MLQDLGFSYLPSQFAYKRKSGEFTQRISITLSHDNSQYDIKFWSSFNVDSPQYNAWRKERGMERSVGHLGGTGYWNIPGWRADGTHSTSFDFSVPAQRPYVIQDWLSGCLHAGIPYLELLSSWSGLGEDLLRLRRDWGRAADFFLIAEMPDRVVAVLEAGIDALRARDFSISEHTHAILANKKRREAAERDGEIATYLERIKTITANKSVDATARSPLVEPTSTSPTHHL